MPTYFNSYVANFNRVRMSELIDFHAEVARRNNVKPSLVVHPWTGQFYDRPTCERPSCEHSAYDHLAAEISSCHYGTVGRAPHGC